MQLSGLWRGADNRRQRAANRNRGDSTACTPGAGAGVATAANHGAKTNYDFAACAGRSISGCSTGSATANGIRKISHA
jgi:hypothetical protein